MAYLLSSLGLVSQTTSFTSVTGHVNNALYTVGSATNQNSSVANTAVNVFLVSEQVVTKFNSYSNVASLASITTNNVVTQPVIITSSVDSVNYLNLNRGFTTTYSGLGDVVFLTARSTNSSNVQLLDLSKNNVTLVANSNVTVSANGPVTDDNPTYKSLFFNGTDRSWVRVTDSSVFDFGVGDFTIEFFVRPYSFATAGSVVDNWISGGGTYIPGQWQVRYVGTNGVLAFNYATSSSANSIVLQTTAAATPLNTWTHVAIVRNNGTGKNRVSSGVTVNNMFLYVNGQAVRGTLSNAYIGVNITGNSSSIGRTTGGNTNFFQGNVSNLRVSKKAVYTGNVYTVPTVRLELIQNAVTTGNANVSALVSGNTVATVSVNTETRTALIPSYGGSQTAANTLIRYVEFGSQTITVTNNLKYNSAVTTANVRRVMDSDFIQSSMNLLASNNVYQTSLTAFTPSFVLSGIDANPNNPNKDQAVIKNTSRINDPARIDIVSGITRPAFFQSGITGENVIDQQNWF